MCRCVPCPEQLARVQHSFKHVHAAMLSPSQPLTPLLQIVMADTSFSDMSSKSRPTDNRGVAASEVRVCGPVLHVHGTLQDSVPVSFVSVTDRELFPPSTPIFMRPFASAEPSPAPALCSLRAIPLSDVTSDGNIGQLTKGGFFVKSRTAEAEPKYLLCKVCGRDYTYEYVCADDLPALLL